MTFCIVIGAALYVGALCLVGRRLKQDRESMERRQLPESFFRERGMM